MNIISKSSHLNLLNGRRYIFSHLFDSSSLAMRFFFYFIFCCERISKCRALFLTLLFFFFSHFFASCLCCVIIFTEWEITVTLGFLSPPIVYIYIFFAFRKVERNLPFYLILTLSICIVRDVVVLLLSVFNFSVGLISSRQGNSFYWFFSSIFATQKVKREKKKNHWQKRIDCFGRRLFH